MIYFKHGITALSVLLLTMTTNAVAMEKTKYVMRQNSVGDAPSKSEFIYANATPQPSIGSDIELGGYRGEYQDLSESPTRHSAPDSDEIKPADRSFDCWDVWNILKNPHRSSSSSQWFSVGDLCGPRPRPRPRPLAGAEDSINESFLELLPRPKIESFPPKGFLVQLETYFSVLTPLSVNWRDLGIDHLKVDIAANAEVSWYLNFLERDSHSKLASNTFQRISVNQITSVFSESGKFRVIATVIWKGNYRIGSGSDWFPLEPIRFVTTKDVLIGEGNSILTQ